jgi:hypothetical protein
MPSGAGCEALDLDQGLPTTPADVAALRRLRQRPAISTAELLRALAELPQPSREALRKRKGPGGAEPLRLVA